MYNAKEQLFGYWSVVGQHSCHVSQPIFVIISSKSGRTTETFRATCRKHRSAPRARAWERGERFPFIISKCLFHRVKCVVIRHSKRLQKITVFGLFPLRRFLLSFLIWRPQMVSLCCVWRIKFDLSLGKSFSVIFPGKETHNLADWRKCVSRRRGLRADLHHANESKQNGRPVSLSSPRFNAFLGANLFFCVSALQQALRLVFYRCESVYRYIYILTLKTHQADIIAPVWVCAAEIGTPGTGNQKLVWFVLSIQPEVRQE